MKSSSPSRRKEVGLIILSVVDVVTGVLSLVITALAIQVIAVMASGLTLIKAIKVVIQSEKTATLIKPVAIYAVRKITRSEKMKGVFGKLKENIKNNPITLVATIIELAVCGGLGYILLGFVSGFSWAVGWKLYAAAFGAATVIYAVLVVLTIYLGHDNKMFAYIRRVVKAIGGDSAVKVLEVAMTEAEEALKTAEREREAEEAARKAREEEEARRKAEEDEIYQYAIAQEAEKKAKEEAMRRAALVNAYSEEFRRKNAEQAVNVAREANPVQEVINNAGSHNI